jgi:hypothetical protein
VSCRDRCRCAHTVCIEMTLQRTALRHTPCHLLASAPLLPCQAAAQHMTGRQPGSCLPSTLQMRGTYCQYRYTAVVPMIKCTSRCKNTYHDCKPSKKLERYCLVGPLDQKVGQVLKQVALASAGVIIRTLTSFVATFTVVVVVLCWHVAESIGIWSWALLGLLGLLCNFHCLKATNHLMM